MEDKMLDFVKDAFRNFIGAILWINLILCTVAGGIVGALTDNAGYAFLGILIGVIIGLLTDIIGGGFIATILNIDANLESLKYNSSKSGNVTTGTQVEKKCQNCGKMIENGYTACPHCGSGSLSSSIENLSEVSSIIRKILIEGTKRCKTCGKSVDSSFTLCPHCTGSEFT